MGNASVQSKDLFALPLLNQQVFRNRVTWQDRTPSEQLRVLFQYQRTKKCDLNGHGMVYSEQLFFSVNAFQCGLQIHIHAAVASTVNGPPILTMRTNPGNCLVTNNVILAHILASYTSLAADDLTVSALLCPLAIYSACR